MFLLILYGFFIGVTSFLTPPPTVTNFRNVTNNDTVSLFNTSTLGVADAANAIASAFKNVSVANVTDNLRNGTLPSFVNVSTLPDTLTNMTTNMTTPNTTMMTNIIRNNTTHMNNGTNTSEPIPTTLPKVPMTNNSVSNSTKDDLTGDSSNATRNPAIRLQPCVIGGFLLLMVLTILFQ